MAIAAVSRLPDVTLLERLAALERSHADVLARLTAYERPRAAIGRRG